MTRRANRLFDLEIDEVSSVDRPGNQLGLIEIAKSLGGTPEEGAVEDEIFDADGYAVDVDSLEHGDNVFDAEGNEYVFVEDGADEDDYADDEQLAGVGKAFKVDAAGTATKLGADLVHVGPSSRGIRRRAFLRRNRGKIAAGAGGAAGVAGGGAYYLAQKSLGDQVLEELSKAVTDDQREAVIAKALDRVSQVEADNARISKELADERDERITEAFIAKAAEYNLPVAPEVLGPILKNAASVLTDAELNALDDVLTAAGEAIFNEIGYGGGASNNMAFDQINGMASELVGKAGGDVSLEQAATALFEANPAAYDAYLAENGR